ncbi:hypothetical protein TNCV_3488251 [Trichonephila clavipes]|nr:hypothetical protein TNCV_3488251 [Trichonephila clavipes]
MDGLGVLKRAENPSKTMNALDELRVYKTRKMLHCCLNEFEKIIVKHLHRSLKIHISQRRRLRESIRRWQRDDWYLLHDNAPAHRSHVIKDFLNETRTGMLPHPPYSSGLTPCDFYMFPSMKKHLHGRHLMS